MSKISDTPSETLVVAASTTISQELLEQLPDAAIALSQDWHIVNLNWRAEQLLCRQPEELIGQRFESCFPAFVDAMPEDREEILPGSLRPAAHFELFYEPAGIYLEVRACAYSAGWLIYLRDLTLQKQAELALSEQSRLEGLSATISQILQQGGELPDILEHCAEGVLQWLEDVSLVRIWHWNGESNLLELQAIAGNVVDANDLPQRISLGISIIGLIAQNRQPYLTNAAQQDICLGAKPWLQAHHIRAFGGYPLIVEDRLVGVLAVHSRHSISQTTHSWLQWITSAMAIAIDRSVARAALLSHRESFLLRLANHIRNSLDLDKILETAVEEVHNLLRLDYCQFLWCWASPGAAGSELQPTLCITHESKQPEYPSLLGECSPSQIPTLANKVLNQQTIRIADSLQVDESELQTLMAGWGMRSLLLLPLETRAGHLGALICGRCEEARFWSDAEVELLQAVTDQLAIAIDQAELYAQTRAAAFAAQTQAQQLSEVLKNLRQTQAQLIQSEKMSSLGQLVAGIAHEINNPVTFISGNLSHASGYFQDLLSLVKLYQQHYPEPVAEIQSHIEEIDLEFMLSDLASVLNSMKIGADRIYKIVLSLRNFSRLDEADVKAVDLHEGIDSTLLILQNRLKSNGSHSGIAVVKQYGDLPLVSCYASQLNQVFMNILSNAIDALQDSEPPYTITIRTEQRQEAIAPDQICTWAVIKIADNGIGMTEELRQKVFDPFFTTKPVGSGTGLGLSISHQIVVEKHKGRIDCHSTPGEGTEFIIEIPVQDEADPVPAVVLEVR